MSNNLTVKLEGGGGRFAKAELEIPKDIFNSIKLRCFSIEKLEFDPDLTVKLEGLGGEFAKTKLEIPKDIFNPIRLRWFLIEKVKFDPIYDMFKFEHVSSSL